MINNWAMESYWMNDIILWQDISIEDIVIPKGPVTEYNQDEYQSNSSYCTWYWCFTNYSYLTWKNLDKYYRKLFIDTCLSEWLIIPWVWWYVDKVVYRFLKFARDNFDDKLIVVYANMRWEDRTKYQEKWIMLITWFRWDSNFIKDRQDNCHINDIPIWDWDWWHCINEQDKWLTTDNYFPRRCNQYIIDPYNDFINSSRHFVGGYFFTYLKDKTMTEVENTQINVQNILALYYANKATYNNITDETLKNKLAETNDYLRKTYPDICK